MASDKHIASYMDILFDIYIIGLAYLLFLNKYV